MILEQWANLELSEAQYVGAIPLLEDEAGPRLRFNYLNYHWDPTPDILLLGSYRHPSTGNNLVGGVNLHYLSNDQRNSLAKALPKLMAPGNLYGRYWAGRRLLPDIFNKFYRTYNSRYIQNAASAVMYPKYGLTKSALNWLQKKVLGAFKGKKQKEQEAQPQYPQDLSDLQQRLDQATATTQRSPMTDMPQEPAPDDAAMRNARMNFLAMRRQQQAQRAAQQATQPPVDLDQVDDVADLQMQQAEQDALQQAQTGQQPIQPQPEPTGLEVIPNNPVDFQQEVQDNEEELRDPRNDVDLEEAVIIYYSPLTESYVRERLAI